MSSCCHNEPPKKTSCCDTGSKNSVDYMFWSCLSLVLICLAGYFLAGLIPLPSVLDKLFTAVTEISRSMIWGLLLGILMVALLVNVPREFVMSILGNRIGLRGILRATAAGVLLDLCSHGILMVGSKLYQRGASLGQVMAFLIASPWNSFSLTLILIAMIGLSWTLVYIVLSIVIAIVTGLLFDALVGRGVLADNPNRGELDENFKFWPEAKKALRGIKFSWGLLKDFLWMGMKESRMVIRWLLLGILIAALLRVFVDAEHFSHYLGPTLLGLGVTLLAATIIEVCSEGAAPVAADIVNRAHAPGNGFAFLMAGVSTDYTEIMVIKDTTRSWKSALFLPLLTLPQIVVFALIIHMATA